MHALQTFWQASRKTWKTHDIPSVSKHFTEASEIHLTSICANERLTEIGTILVNHYIILMSLYKGDNLFVYLFLHSNGTDGW